MTGKLVPGPERMFSTLVPVTVPVGVWGPGSGRSTNISLTAMNRDSVASGAQPKLVTLNAEGGCAFERGEVRGLLLHNALRRFAEHERRSWRFHSDVIAGHRVSCEVVVTPGAAIQGDRLEIQGNLSPVEQADDRFTAVIV